MGFFTVGNLITLLIVVIVLFLFRQLDRNRRAQNNLRKFVENAKEDLAAYAQKQGEIVRDFSIQLSAERDVAGELMRQLQQLTREEMAEKAAMINQIEERIGAYDKSLSELARMTARVQENLARIREESAFVENTGKRINEAKEKMLGIEKTQIEKLDALEKIQTEKISALEKTEAAKIAALEQNLSAMENRVEQENIRIMENMREETLASVKNLVSGLESRAETIERIVEDHREAVEKIETERKASLNRDIETINKTLATAVERAGQRADKMEEAALVKLRDQAQERLHRLQSSLEEKLRSGQDIAKTMVADLQDRLKTHREQWKADLQEIEGRRKQFKEEWKKDIQEIRDIESAMKTQREDWAGLSAELNTAMEKQKNEWAAIGKEAGEHLAAVAADMEQEALRTAADRLAEHREAQARQFKALEKLADDASGLDRELRTAMAETVSRFRSDFARFEETAAQSRQDAAAAFDTQLKTLSAEIGSVEEELNALKERAYDNVSENLKVFEDDFFADLSRRSTAIDSRLLEWQESLEQKLSDIFSEAEKNRLGMEHSLAEEVRNSLTERRETLLASLAELKQETDAFGSSIRETLRSADEERVAFRTQIEMDLADTRRDAEAAAKAEIGRYNLSMSETLKNRQRELDEWQSRNESQLRDLDSSLEEIRRRIRDFSQESDEKLVVIRGGINEVGQEADSVRQELLRTNELKRELDHYIEDLKGEMDKLEAYKGEAARLENEFLRIKRLEDDISSRMNRFINVQHQIDQIEARYDRVIQTSQAVEEKLAQVTSSDDTIQAVQVQLRRLDDLIRETEERYQRIEKKNATLQETGDSIDRNFTDLQKTEEEIRLADSELKTLFTEIENCKAAVTELAAESRKAQDASDKIILLDDTLTSIESRIEEMNKARDWLARAETRLEEINQDVLDNLRRTSPKDSKKQPPESQGSLPPRDRENIHKLHQQGWTIEELAANYKVSRGEIELILEMGPDL
ncbi:MAG: hypothetical protein LBC57_09405 [Treponema sp.]|jgi:chromosome segregation ATPase|nr:hypothetical protein [Treponema sp.]